MNRKSQTGEFKSGPDGVIMGVIATTFGGKVIWSYFSQFEVTEGLIVIALLLLLTFVIKFTGLGSLFDSRFSVTI